MKRADADPTMKAKKGKNAKEYDGIPKEMDGKLMRIAGPPDHGAKDLRASFVLRLFHCSAARCCHFSLSHVLLTSRVFLPYSGHGSIPMWNDVAWSIGFAVAFCFTVFLAIYKNIEEEIVVEVTICSSSPCLNGGECLILRGVALEASGEVEAYECNCADGWVGQVCQIQVAKTGDLGQNSTYQPASGFVAEEVDDTPQLTHVHVASIVTIAVVAAFLGACWSALWLMLLKWEPFLESIVKVTMLGVAAAQLWFGIWLL